MGVVMTPGYARRVASPNGPAHWALAGFGLYVVGGMVMLFVSLWISESVLRSMGIDSSAGTIGLSIRNAAHPIGWGIFVAALSIPIGRRLVPDVRVGAASWTLLAAGLALATVATFLAIEFVRQRQGYFSIRGMGFVSFVTPALVGMALAAWATLALPRDRARPPARATLAAVAVLALSLLPSIDGARNGIKPSSVPLVVVLGLSVVYAALVSLIVIRHVVRRRSE